MTSPDSRLARCVNIAAELAGLLVQIRGKPRLLDVVAISAKLVDVGLRIREEVSYSGADNAWGHFSYDRPGSPWKLVSSIFVPLLRARIEKPRQVTRGANDKALTGWEGEIRGLRVGWILNGEKIDALFVDREQASSLCNVISDAAWALIPSGHAVMRDTGLADDPLEPARVVRTAIVQETQEIAKAFLDAGERHSCLLIGAPGTGKSTAIQHLARSTGLRSIRIPLSTLRPPNRPQSFDDWTLDSVVAAMRPDILIIDDIDRASQQTQNELLEFVDSGRCSARIFIASANDVQNIIAPLRRPERFDEHIHVPPLSLEEREQLLGDDDRDVAGEMEGWPISYVAYYSKLVRVLGRERARFKISEMKQRITETHPVLKDRSET